jgi:dolichol-phosphate mannosyltransferase
MAKVVVVIPTYNEAENITNLTTELFTLPVSDIRILVVDDASPDGTGILLINCYTASWEIPCNSPSGKLGLGTAYIQGFKWALQNQADYIVQMDADFSHDPGYITQFVDLMEQYEVVIGSRYVSGGRLDECWGIGRKLLSMWANSIWVRIILGVKTRDATAGFKCWQASALALIDLDNIRSNGYVFQVEMCYIAEKLGLKIKEIPIYFQDRRIGQSKMTMRVKLEAATSTFAIRKRYRRLKAVNSSNPLL